MQSKFKEVVVAELLASWPRTNVVLSHDIKWNATRGLVLPYSVA
jgi:hypothetical protein